MAGLDVGQGIQCRRRPICCKPDGVFSPFTPDTSGRLRSPCAGPLFTAPAALPASPRALDSHRSRRVTGGSRHEWKEGSRRACSYHRPSCSLYLSRCWVVLPRGPKPMRWVCAPLQPGRRQSGAPSGNLRQPRRRPIIWVCPSAGWRLAGGAQLSSLMRRDPHDDPPQRYQGLELARVVIRLEPKHV